MDSGAVEKREASERDAARKNGLATAAIDDFHCPNLYLTDFWVARRKFRPVPNIFLRALRDLSEAGGRIEFVQSPMTKTKKYKSKIKAVIHETAADLYETGLIDKQTMRRFDDSCLAKVHRLSAKEIRALRSGLF